MKQLIPLLIVFLLLIIVMASCGPDLQNGKPVDVNAPQAKEQCVAQPELAWCKK